MCLKITGDWRCPQGSVTHWWCVHIKAKSLGKPLICRPGACSRGNTNC